MTARTSFETTESRHWRHDASLELRDLGACGALPRYHSSAMLRALTESMQYKWAAVACWVQSSLSGLKTRMP